MRSRIQPQKASALSPSTPSNEESVGISSSNTIQKQYKSLSFTEVIRYKLFNSKSLILRCFYFVLIIWLIVLLVYLSLCSKVSHYSSMKKMLQLSCNNSSNDQKQHRQHHLRVKSTSSSDVYNYNNLNNITIFYSIHLPSLDSKSSSSSSSDNTITTTLNVIKEQIQYYEESKIFTNNVNPLFYYNIIPQPDLKSNENMINEAKIYDDVINMINKVNGRKILIKIRELQNTNNKEQNLELITLSSLYNYCQNNPYDKVIYMHNNINKNISYKLLKMSTKSVFTDECLLMGEDDENNDNNNIDESSSCECNMCSGRFTPIPNYHTPGNIFISKCSYINQLMSPLDFENAMDFVLQNMSSDRKEEQQKIFLQDESNSAYLGTKEYSIYHWPFSHPNVCPCDIYPGLYRFGNTKGPDHLPSITSTTNNTSWKPLLKKGPRFPEIEDYIIYTRNFMSNKKVGNTIPTFGDIYAQKWYYVLSNRIYQWKLLYGITPYDDSWIWTFYKNSNFLKE